MESRAESYVAAVVEAVKRDPRRRDSLSELLPERIPLYQGLSTNATMRMRGYLLAAFEQVGLPPAALPYVLEELESGREAYLVAAAAKALRGLDQPTGLVVGYLLKAIQNIMYADDTVSFDGYGPSRPPGRTLSNGTTAMDEILRTLAWLGDHARPALPLLEHLNDTPGALSASAREVAADILSTHRSGADSCCQASDGDSAPLAEPLRLVPHRRDSSAIPVDIEFEDQDGRSLTYGDYFTGGPAVVVFFYTRCDNPNKCSLSITKLALLQRTLRGEDPPRRVRTAAITYDPSFDRPARLQAYGRNRGVVFGDDDRFMRTRKGFSVLQEYFELGVNYGPALVNRHRIELYLLDPKGRISHASTRSQWNIEDVLSALR